MPKNGRSKGKSRKDKNQDVRIKKLEDLVLKTMENKQVNYHATNQSITSGGYASGSFLNTSSGAGDGDALGSAARVGNSITLLNQRVCMNFTGSSTDTYNQIRVILCESMDGNQPLALSDVLEYHSYTLYGSLVFASPYTTKTSSNRRYKIHMDKSFVLSGLPTKGGVPPAKVIKHVIRYKGGKVIDFDGTGAVNPNNHRLTILLISDSVSASHPILDFATRSTYKDA